MNVTDRVHNILKVSRDARNSDKELCVIYMQKSGMNLSEEQIRVFKSMPSMETIRRVRQKIQESGEYQADQKIKSERKFKSLQMQQTAPTFTPNNMGKILDGATYTYDGRRVLDN